MLIPGGRGCLPARAGIGPGIPGHRPRVGRPRRRPARPRRAPVRGPGPSHRKHRGTQRAGSPRRDRCPGPVLRLRLSFTGPLARDTFHLLHFPHLAGRCAPEMARVHVLGARTPTPTPSRFGSSFAVEVGGGIPYGGLRPSRDHKLVKAGLWPTSVDYLFFTPPPLRPRRRLSLLPAVQVGPEHRQREPPPGLRPHPDREPHRGDHRGNAPSPMTGRPG